MKIVKNSKTFILNFNKCNQKCLFCMKAEDIESRHNLTYNTVVKEIINAKNKGFKNIDFYGGEPTCFIFLQKAIKFVNDLGMTATLATNAVKFSSNTYVKLFFSGVNIEGVRASLHSNQPEIHDAITQVRGSFYKTIEGIKNILEYNKRLTVNIVITSLNYKVIIDMVDYIYNLGVRGIKFSGLILRGRASVNERLTVGIHTFLPYLLKALKRAKELGFYYIEVEKLPRQIFKNETLEFVHFLDET